MINEGGRGRSICSKRVLGLHGPTTKGWGGARVFEAQTLSAHRIFFPPRAPENDPSPTASVSPETAHNPGRSHGSRAPVHARKAKAMHSLAYSVDTRIKRNGRGACRIGEHSDPCSLAWRSSPRNDVCGPQAWDKRALACFVHGVLHLCFRSPAGVRALLHGKREH